VPIGVIAHLAQSPVTSARAIGAATEAAGADWVGLPDIFWGVDTWVLAAEVARATSRVALGPVVTNPFSRHPFHTLSALATVQELAGPRVFLGLGAGGSELSEVAGISRKGASARVEALADLARRVADGEPLEASTGLQLALALAVPQIMVAGRRDQILRTGGRVADQVLLWGVPKSDLERSVDVVNVAAAERPYGASRPPEIIWAPLVVAGAEDLPAAGAMAAYAVLSSYPFLHRRWGLSAEDVAGLRRRVVSTGPASAADLLPGAAVEDLVSVATTADEAAVVESAALLEHLGIGSVAVPVPGPAQVAPLVAWARAVLDRARPKVSSGTGPRATKTERNSQ
jgi:alkanesulfonate monooxygenase SsuD/methylene tetrahydromethanopterin reductase-like flavin-dependent oxidoreductase (luciferase family)